MTTTQPSAITPAEAREAAVTRAACGSMVKAAAVLGITKSALQRRLRKADAWGITARGEVVASIAQQWGAPAAGVSRYLVTAAQSNTEVHAGLWANLTALAAHVGARILVGRIRYNHTPEQVGQEKDNRTPDRGLWYDDRLAPHFCDDRVELCPGLIWAGDMNILPTATDPLSGLDSFTGADSCIFPHPQLALKSVATAPRTPTKFNYTTGAVTLKNYIKRKVGLKAEFHHAYAALMIEVDAAGDWFVRQVNADNTGAIHDLDLSVEGGRVRTGDRIEVFTPGDIHGTEADPVALAALWGAGGLVGALRPKVQVLHDVLNFGARSHHMTVFDTFAAHFARRESVEAEIAATAAVLNGLTRPDMRSVVVKANHDEHLDRWVRECDYRRDPINAPFYLAAAAAMVEAIRSRDLRFDLTAWALRRAGADPSVEFLRRDDDLMLCGIDHAQHGDLGPNGSRGSAGNLARIGVKSNIGHSHAATIRQGCYQAGTSSLLDMGYNRGPSNWSHSSILTYGNGKRSIVTLRGGKWRAI